MIERAGPLGHEGGFSALDAKKMQEINMQRTEGFREAETVALEGSRDSWGKR